MNNHIFDIRIRVDHMIDWRVVLRGSLDGHVLFKPYECCNYCNTVDGWCEEWKDIQWEKNPTSNENRMITLWECLINDQ